MYELSRSFRRTNTINLCSDVKNLVADTDVTEELAPAIEQYNKEQLVTVTLPGGSQRV